MKKHIIKQLTAQALLAAGLVLAGGGFTPPAAAHDDSPLPPGVKIDKKDILAVYKYITEITNERGEFKDSRSLLKQQGIEVISIETGYDGLIYSLKNGEDKHLIEQPNKKHYFQRGRILIVKIKKSDWEAAQKHNFQLCSDLDLQGGHCYPSSYASLFPETRDKAYVAVFKSSGQEQCASSDSPSSLDETAQELTEKNIFIYKQYKGTSGEIYTLQCGHETNHINVYVIEKSKLGIASLLGFQECTWLKTKGQDCHPLRQD